MHLMKICCKFYPLVSRMWIFEIAEMLFGLNMERMIVIVSQGTWSYDTLLLETFRGKKSFR